MVTKKRSYVAVAAAILSMGVAGIVCLSLLGDSPSSIPGARTPRLTVHDQSHRESYQLGQRARETLRGERISLGMTAMEAAPDRAACERKWGRQYAAVNVTEQDLAAFIAGCLDGAVDEGSP